jgi:Ni/Co efflux regulator RcnB
MKKIVVIFLLFFYVGSLTIQAQFSESKERRKMWRKSSRKHKAREAYNPYLDKKKKDKPSSKIAKEEKSGSRKMKREYKRQNKRNMKKLGIKPVKVKRAK